MYVCAGSREPREEMSADSLPSRRLPGPAAVVVLHSQQAQLRGSYRVSTRHRAAHTQRE